MKTGNKFNNAITDVCRKSCQKVLAQIAAAKNSILAQFQDVVAEHEQVLRLALNEAEALAWETSYPQLVFPDLAEEKTRGVLAWVAHQKAVRQ